MEDRMHGKREARSANRIHKRIEKRIVGGVRIGIALIAGIGLLVYLAFIAGVLLLAGKGLQTVWGFIFG
ncbi:MULTISPECIES: hypothetical protein [Saccharibacillus]|uniref:hypothetical protein n=1 Tax=Saccharibacillus TaxID=456492 RepID=UPI00123ACE9D|nr:hypothetical protein [Saccharibacillus sp. WB 17]MWJ31025.1 hypothetical protein [Saccharibacillus sp. WB 17]